jgi:hypothetical protein
MRRGTEGDEPKSQRAEGSRREEGPCNAEQQACLTLEQVQTRTTAFIGGDDMGCSHLHGRATCGGKGVATLP